MSKDMSRREFLKKSAAASAVIMESSTMLRNSLPVLGSVHIPEVDKLTVTVITDNYYDTFRSGNDMVKRFSMLDALEASAFMHAEHGLSYHIATEITGHSHSFLFDYGLDAHGVNRNIELLRIDLAKVEALGLSHGHLDHWENLVPLLRQHRKKFRQNLPLYVGEEAFAKRFIKKDGVLTSIRQLSKEEIEALGFVKIIEVSEPTLIAPGVYLTGVIERETEYEKVQPYLMIQRGDTVEPDAMRGEQSLMVNIKSKGLVVLTSCAHAGVINTIKHAQTVTGVKKVHAVLGGFHLTGAQHEIIDRTVTEMKAIAPDYIVPMHCSGFEAQAAFAQEMPGAFILNTAGSRYTFSA